MQPTEPTLRFVVARLRRGDWGADRVRLDERMYVRSSTASRRPSMAALAIHVMLDNGSSYVSKQTKAWFAAHPRWMGHYTPPHALGQPDRVVLSRSCSARFTRKRALELPDLV